MCKSPHVRIQTISNTPPTDVASVEIKHDASHNINLISSWENWQEPVVDGSVHDIIGYGDKKQYNWN